MRDAFIFDAIRTPRAKGKPGGSFYELKPIYLLSSLLQALKTRNQLHVDAVDDVLIGCVNPIDDQGSNLARSALLFAGWDKGPGGMQINRYGASGLEAVNLGAMKIRSAWDELVIAGGIECMSRIPIGSDGGPLSYDPELIQKVAFIPQGISADLTATLENFDRTELDQFALQSHQRAQQAWEKDYFQKSIIPIYDSNGLLVLAQDEIYRKDTDLETLLELPAAFEELGRKGFDVVALQHQPELENIHHLHTAGNSSVMVDGAALVLMGSAETGKQYNWKPRAKILATAVCGIQPPVLLTGHIPATEKALKMATLKASDIDLWECHESFAAVSLSFQRNMKIEPERFNVNGGAIAMGHPSGATGAILVGKLLDELERQDLEFGLIAIGVSGGMGSATIIQRI